ncbi:hypothetical protein ACOMHN_047288 [Nucella lapillus]
MARKLSQRDKGSKDSGRHRSISVDGVQTASSSHLSFLMCRVRLLSLWKFDNLRCSDREFRRPVLMVRSSVQSLWKFKNLRCSDREFR